MASIPETIFNRKTELNPMNDGCIVTVGENSILFIISFDRKLDNHDFGLEEFNMMNLLYFTFYFNTFRS